jgi:hypothetical protein
MASPGFSNDDVILGTKKIEVNKKEQMFVFILILALKHVAFF